MDRQVSGQVVHTCYEVKNRTSKERGTDASQA